MSLTVVDVLALPGLDSTAMSDDTPTPMMAQYLAIRAANPRAIYASISGYGQSGPRANDAGHDINYQAIGGLLGQYGGRRQQQGQQQRAQSNVHATILPQLPGPVRPPQRPWPRSPPVRPASRGRYRR